MERNRFEPPGAVQRLAVTPLSHGTKSGRWRTEAMRSHAVPRLLHFTKGQGRITVAGLTSGYGPNNMIFVPARTMYGYELTGGVFGTMLTIPGAMAAEWPEEPVHLRLRDVVAQKEATSLIDNLERELKSDRPGADRAAHYHLGLLAIYFQRQIEARPADAANPRSESSAARLVAAYADLVERDFRSPRGVSDYARLLGVTPTHLTRCCRQTCGRSAHGLLNERVLYEARIMLRETASPVQEVARRLGFASAAYFTRAFQAKIGQTPSAFRRSGTEEVH